MRQTSRLSLLAGAAIAAIPTSSALAEGQAWSNSDEVRALVSEMIADSETRSSMLQSGATAGHDGKFFIASSDGNYRLNIGGQVQFRLLMDFRDDNVDEDNADDSSQSDFEKGFQTRRTKLWFSGNAGDPNLFYKIQGNFDFNESGTFTLEDAYLGYDFNEGWSIRWGQFKLPFMREFLVGSGYQLAVERSLVESIFSGGRGQGMELTYKGETFKWDLCFSDGFNTANSDFGSNRTINNNSLPSGGESQWSFTTRLEFLFAGDWDAFKDFSSPAGSDFGMLFGLAGHIEGGDGDSSGFSTGDYTYYAWTADLSFEGDGWNAFLAFNGSYTDYDDVPDGLGGEDNEKYDDYGLVAQAGFFIPNSDWEPYIRYSLVMPDSSRPDSPDDFNTVTAGVNYYMAGHAAKFTADVVYYIDKQENGYPETDTGLPYLGDDDDGEVAIRLQWQMLF